jgi:hypothetical protein
VFIIFSCRLCLAVAEYDIPKTTEQCRAKLRELFLKNKDITDIRVIDMLAIKVSDWDSSLSLFSQYYTHVICIFPF